MTPVDRMIRQLEGIEKPDADPRICAMVELLQEQPGMALELFMLAGIGLHLVSREHFEIFSIRCANVIMDGGTWPMAAVADLAEVIARSARAKATA